MTCESVCKCVCVLCVREREGHSAASCVCVRDGERERGGDHSAACVCVWEMEREREGGITAQRVCVLACVCVWERERERERLSHSAASCVCVREKERGRERGPVPIGTLNPRGLPLSPHFHDVMLLWLSGRNLLQSLPQCELGRSADRGHITAAHGNTLLSDKIKNGTS